MVSLALIFFSQLFVVLLLGVQQDNVRRAAVTRAAVTSLGIGLCQLAAYWFIPRATTASEFVCFLAGGPVGIAIAIWINARREKK